MPQDDPQLGDCYWSLDLGNCSIIDIDVDEDTVLVEVVSWGGGKLGDVYELDLYTVTSQWTDRFGGLYMDNTGWPPEQTVTRLT